MTQATGEGHVEHVHKRQWRPYVVFMVGSPVQTEAGYPTNCEIRYCSWEWVTPIAFRTMGWKFYLCFIVPGSISRMVIWVLFPDTKGVALEEVAAIFGDKDEMAVYEEEVGTDLETAKVELKV